MAKPTDDQIVLMLMGIISDGFNRSLGALKQSGAIDTRKMQSEYVGVGSKYYDLVTEQILVTARYGAPAVQKLFENAE
jgi:hypothetical protein